MSLSLDVCVSAARSRRGIQPARNGTASSASDPALSPHSRRRCAAKVKGTGDYLHSLKVQAVQRAGVEVQLAISGSSCLCCAAAVGQAGVTAEASTDLQHAQDALRKQQEQQTQPAASLSETKALVETAMLAAVSGLAFTLGSLLRVDSYLGYFLPMPVVVAAMRSGPAAGRKTMTATCFLLMLLLGPFRAVTYFFLHGLSAVCLGGLWSLRVSWVFSLAAGILARLVGLLGYIALTSWVLNENIYGLLLQNAYSFLDWLGGGVGTASPVLVAGLVGLSFALNSVMVAGVMHLLYIPLLRGMGFKTTQLPSKMTALGQFMVPGASRYAAQ